MRVYYDFHIHSVLSACAEDDMTINNIINMAKIKGLDVIAITDHNSARNLPAAVEAGNRLGILVVPGMEVQTKEDVHMICLFPDLDSAFAVERIIEQHTVKKLNDVQKYGEQVILDSYDKVIGYESASLLSGTTLGIDELADAVETVGGACIPAHVNRESYSILTKFGNIPARFRLVEVTRDDYEVNCPIIRNSDAHSLGNISEKVNFLEIEEKSCLAIIKKIKKM